MLPYFYHSSAGIAGDELLLDEENSRHIVQVLRMKPGAKLLLTNGIGELFTAAIVDDHKKKCRVRIESVEQQPLPKREIGIALSPLKNASRFEWFLEKATELGVRGIVPLLTERTERQHHRPDRWKNILVSALLQSQQAWLPKLAPPLAFAELMAGINGKDVRVDRRLIAHCLEAPRPTESLANLVRTQPATSTLILIGPEGDFSPNEVELALAEGFTPVTLGANRLRTETAGVVAATLLCVE
ncbi:MAG TPA: RsmE family RNA methyltransferase [Puia sp.]